MFWSKPPALYYFALRQVERIDIEIVAGMQSSARIRTVEVDRPDTSVVVHHILILYTTEDRESHAAIVAERQVEVGGITNLRPSTFAVPGTPYATAETSTTRVYELPPFQR